MATWQPNEGLIEAVSEYLRERFPQGQVEHVVPGCGAPAVQFTVRLPRRHYHLHVNGQFFDDLPSADAILVWLRAHGVAEGMDKSRSSSNTVILGVGSVPAFPPQEDRLVVGSRWCPECQRGDTVTVTARQPGAEECECGTCGKRFTHRFRFES
jgi:Zn ribbon nucleic-acid-binding protein